jgi:glycosyltransferase involved in cell wall biosynthesis
MSDQPLEIHNQVIRFCVDLKKNSLCKRVFDMPKNENILQLFPEAKIAVIIPCFRVTRHILDVIAGIGPEVWRIYVVDDACPDGSGRLVGEKCSDERVRIIFHKTNQGVGGAVITGYMAALDDEADVMVKIDGDGQMDPSLISYFVTPLLSGEADYTKGNRFFDIEKVRQMPGVRIFGNAVLSFMAKLSTGYWNLFDPTNGYTAIHACAASILPYDRISRRYFFETDMLFRLNTLCAVVVDIPMDARYGDEVSNLKIKSIIGEFLVKHLHNFWKRIFYNYYLRDLSIASIELPIGILMMVLGVLFGGYKWFWAAMHHTSTPAGTVMFAALPIILGLQLVLAFLGYDISRVPKTPRQKRFIK